MSEPSQELSFSGACCGPRTICYVFVQPSKHDQQLHIPLLAPLFPNLQVPLGPLPFQLILSSMLARPWHLATKLKPHFSLPSRNPALLCSWVPMLRQLCYPSFDLPKARAYPYQLLIPHLLPWSKVPAGKKCKGKEQCFLNSVYLSAMR